jgi:hypothetical protein
MLLLLLLLLLDLYIMNIIDSGVCFNKQYKAKIYYLVCEINSVKRQIATKYHGPKALPRNKTRCLNIA